jgi:hypothetical protein
MTIQGEKVSTFALIVDKLRKLDEAELKLAYIRLFKEDILTEWKALTENMDLMEVSEDEITEAFFKQRYPSNQ